MHDDDDDFMMMMMMGGGGEWSSYAAPTASGLSWLTLPNHPLGPLDHHDRDDDEVDDDDDDDDDDCEGIVL